jgi:hypothetical protein
MKIGLHIYYLVFEGRLSVLIGNVDIEFEMTCMLLDTFGAMWVICSWEGALEIHTPGMKFKVRMSGSGVNV